jgi:hypothetical protein
MSRKGIVVRAVLPLSRMAAFWIQNAAMRDNRCRDRVIIAVFPTTQCAPAYSIALSLQTHSPPRSQTGPTMTDSGSPQSPKAPTPPERVASSPPSSPREARYHRRHGRVAGSPAAGISSRDRSKPRKPTTFCNPLTSEDKMPNIFYSVYMFICSVCSVGRA